MDPVIVNVKYGLVGKDSELRALVDKLPGLVAEAASFNGLRVVPYQVRVEASPYGRLVRNDFDLEVQVLTGSHKRYLANAQTTAKKVRDSVEEMFGEETSILVTVSPELLGVAQNSIARS